MHHREAVKSRGKPARGIAVEPPGKQCDQQEGAQIEQCHDRPSHQRDVFQLRKMRRNEQEVTPPVRRHQPCHARYQPFGSSRGEGKDVQRKMPVSEISLLADDLAILRRPAERIHRRSRDVQEFGEAVWKFDGGGNPDHVPFVRMRELEAVPVHRRKSKPRREQKHRQHRYPEGLFFQRCFPVHGLKAAYRSHGLSNHGRSANAEQNSGRARRDCSGAPRAQAHDVPPAAFQVSATFSTHTATS